MKINNSSVNALNTQQNKAEKPEKQQVEEKPQLKEHCSSKAGTALRGVVLGLALAAGVAGAKAMPVKACERNNSEPISVTQEVEETAPQTEVEKIVDDMMSEQESSTVTLHAGEQGHCSGKMKLGCILGGENGRNYDTARITSDGQLVMLREDVYYIDDTAYTTYTEMNRFNLNTNAESRKIDLQTGSRFEETKDKKSDYVELSKDGTQFIVYNENGEEIGTINTVTPDEHNAKLIIGGTVAGGLLIAGAINEAKRRY